MKWTIQRISQYCWAVLLNGQAVHYACSEDEAREFMHDEQEN